MGRFFAHRFVLSLLVIAVAVFFNAQGWLDAPKNAFFWLAYSSQKAVGQSARKISESVNFLASAQITHKQNSHLKEENERLLGEIASLKEVARENEFLREQIGLPAPEERELILAEIIRQDLFGLNRYFLIDKGKKDGVEEKMIVISSGNLLVGQVVEVVESFAKVRLLADPNSRVNVLIQESGIRGLVRSDYGLDLIVDLLPQGKVVNDGEMVITSGLAGLFPAGLLVGQIQKTVSSDVQISQMVKIKPAVDFMELERVFVIK